jgi:hypothetical protein
MIYFVFNTTAITEACNEVVKSGLLQSLVKLLSTTFDIKKEVCTLAFLDISNRFFSVLYPDSKCQQLSLSKKTINFSLVIMLNFVVVVVT